ncbi:MAG TPA: plastocyanin/azurin family copper-binding protein [Euzebya sp.]|nr:plastocyanin/azurin family copper-binding protein [Euzebya sp.]
MRRPHLVLILVLAIGLLGCSKQDPEVAINDQVPASQQVAEPVPGSEGEAAGSGADFAAADAVWSAEGLEFTSSPETVPADGAVLGLEIAGGLPHNVVFEGYQGDEPLVEGPGDGEYAGQASIPAGTYTFYCGIAGHRAAGMEGEVTVE